MGPKAEAAARFVERTGGLAAIGALDGAYEIVHHDVPQVPPEVGTTRPDGTERPGAGGTGGGLRVLRQALLVGHGRRRASRTQMFMR